MDRLVTFQLVVNLVLLANIVHIHRRLRARGSALAVAPERAPAVPAPAPAPPSPPPEAEKRPKKRRGFVLTLGLGSPSPARTAAPAILDLGLAGLVEAAERRETAQVKLEAPPAVPVRQRAADDLRANLRRLQESLASTSVGAGPEARS